MATMQSDSHRRSRHSKKIQKGYTGAYPKQSSIPYKFRTIVIPDSEKKGFNSQTKRFCYKLDDNPGPGFYNVIHQSPEFNSVSISRKGTGAFPSMDTRMYSKTPNYPAANAYNVPSNFTSKKDFSQAGSSMFQLPFCGKVTKWLTPAPNQYDTTVSLCMKRNDLCSGVAFMSKTPRTWTTVRNKLAPSPGHYEINESLVKEAPKLVGCGFKSRTGRDVKITSFVPGPGYYNPNGPIKIPPKKKMIPAPSCSVVSVMSPFGHLALCLGGRKRYALTFSAFPLPPVPKPPIPGPGQYDIVNYDTPQKHYISTSTFVSSTSRWAGNANQTLPGPNTYKPEFPGKQSFIYNSDKKWIPVL
ncbi:O(6)-methylguanine-induced apoptosis 2 [Gracilinanus agilis]|uniref:O(6)-methylguanine-induced apoptosis 2 n=1 Tax=Gracilinanus agilis TaxID=191870 RepID=UPI001CFD60CB|nr:O(6)-methylguanine-induced apoptosis 2 [Gracilinanus agilis]